MRLGVKVLFICLALAHAQSAGGGLNEPARHQKKWDLSLILVGRIRKQKNSVFIPACPSGRAYRSLEAPSSRCRSGWPGSRA